MGLTSDREDPGLKLQSADPHRQGQQQTYLILSGEERAKGFVRPVRHSYKHVGRLVCGIEPNWEGEDWPELPAGKTTRICARLPGHDGECDSWLPVNEGELEQVRRTGALGGCGAVTSMASELAETYARQPDFYGGTFCATCRTHPRVGEYGEFVWVENGRETDLRVGT